MTGAGQHDHDHGARGHDHGQHSRRQHGHEHDHEHPRAPLWRFASKPSGRRRVRWPGWLPHTFRPHSHDAADSVDPALEASGEGIRAVKISLVVLGITAAAQLVVVLFTGSAALLADTIHNFSDALTAVPLWIAFVIGRRPATPRYTYGFGRAEDLAGVFIVAMIALSAVLAGYESISRLIDPRPITNVGAVLIAGLVGFAGNELVAVYRIRVGRKIGSAALVADGLHARTDGFTSLAVVAAALGVLAGFPLADPIVGLLITVAILFVLRGAARDIYRRLMDAVDPGLVDQTERVARGVDGVEDVAELRLRWIGHALRAEINIVVDSALDLRAAHALSHQVEHELLHHIPRLHAAIVHAEPGLGPGVHDDLEHHR
ncbi:MAG: cation diffusion facilitator family transporter [Actinomycetota bacterium]|nr:cation diffusion facilitator family transporter [Actinomycetota bacterium]